LLKEESEALNMPIKKAEMLGALINTPKGKSPGMDRLPYDCYKALPLEATNILTNIGNQVSEKKAQLASWAQKGPAWVGPLSPYTGLSIVKPSSQPGQNINVGA
jgi:hypothetical protein